MIDFLDQMHTRRFLHPLLVENNFHVQCQLSALSQSPAGKLFNQMLENIKFYMGFEIDDHTGAPLTDEEMTNTHYNQIQRLQLAAFKFHQDQLRSFALSNVAAVDTRDALTQHLSNLSTKDLAQLCHTLGLILKSNKKIREQDRDYYLETLVSAHERRPSQKQAIKELPLYPTEVEHV